ncbi:MAG: hypothetical protein KDK30_05825 [Leptospiraceae bacterium]|nr:hypothetical protein [Leptospiraceae bacterium]MCB1314370.1 hypothetical protein [Leptospiraceae bacterium]MCB1323319.1 hypothetical protein [Leptospiraceae bacterium]
MIGRNQIQHATSSGVRFVVVIVFSGLIVLGVTTCDANRSEPVPSAALDFPGFMRVTTDRMCAKMLQCYEKLYRALPPNARRQINVQSCRESALHNLDAKLAIHTPEMRLLSEQCYGAMLATECHEFGAIALYHPACRLLREEVDRAHRNR